jgi:hypothetical protein
LVRMKRGDRGGIETRILAIVVIAKSARR